MGPLEEFIRVVVSKLRRLEYSSPNAATLGALVRAAYLATLRTEEGRFVRGSLTFAHPGRPDMRRPSLRRADYPLFTAFDEAVPLAVEGLVKLSRAVDSWSGSIAVYGKRASDLVAWGVVDQIVHSNIRLNRESESGFAHPGVVTVCMDGVGALSAYHGSLFLASLRQDRVVPQEESEVWSAPVARRIGPFLRPIALRIGAAVEGAETGVMLEYLLLQEWAATIARICIGLRRAGTGGALLVSPHPMADLLHVGHGLPYARLGHAGLLRVLDVAYQHAMEREVLREGQEKYIRSSLERTANFAETDATDRARELTGAVRLVTSLASVDGLVLLTPLLELVGFGVKIRTERRIGRVYVGRDFVRRGAGAACVDLSCFGTRHTSMLRYCRADPQAIGVVVSQDGQVRVVVTMGRSLTLWDNIQLLGYSSDLRRYARMLRRYRKSPERRRRQQLGYSDTPKTLDQLMGRTGRGEGRKGIR